jgi:hypothetical protein
MTLDEYKKQIEAKKRAQTEKLPQFNTRTAGEGEDPKAWQKPAEVYRKKNNADESDEDEEEEVSGAEENESDDDLEEEQSNGKKKLIVIPLHFKPIDVPRGSSRGGRSRGGNPRFRDRPARDEQGARKQDDPRVATNSKRTCVFLLSSDLTQSGTTRNCILSCR